MVTACFRVRAPEPHYATFLVVFTKKGQNMSEELMSVEETFDTTISNIQTMIDGNPVGAHETWESSLSSFYLMDKDDRLRARLPNDVFLNWRSRKLEITTTSEHHTRTISDGMYVWCVQHMDPFRKVDSLGRANLAELQSKINADNDTLSRIMIEAADDNNFCEVYDKAVEEANGLMRVIEIAPRQRTLLITCSLDITVEVPYGSDSGVITNEIERGLDRLDSDDLGVDFEDVNVTSNGFSSEWG